MPNRPSEDREKVLDYLRRYTHRVAMSNDRILNVADGEVSFQWRDYRNRDKSKSRVMTIVTDEFIRRFPFHTLPPGFRHIRHFGFLADRFRREKLELCRKLLSSPVTELLPSPVQCREAVSVLVALQTVLRRPHSPAEVCAAGCDAVATCSNAIVPARCVPSFRSPQKHPTRRGNPFGATTSGR